MQIAPYTTFIPDVESNFTALAELRFAQEAALRLPHTAMVTAVDLGDATSPHRRGASSFSFSFFGFAFPSSRVRAFGKETREHL